MNNTPNFNHKKLLAKYELKEFSDYWEYRDENEHLLGYAVRYEPINPEKKKMFVCWHQKNGKWSYTRWPTLEGMSVYRCAELKKYPNKPVMIVEGEKTADAAALMLKDYVVVTWVGGSSSAKKIDTSLLANRDVYIWPDNDDAGFKAQENLKKTLLPIASNVYCINPSPLGVGKGVGFADFASDHCVIEWDMILIAIDDAKNVKQRFEPIDSETFPFKTAKGNPINTYENVEHLLNFYCIKPRFNELRKEVEAENPYKSFNKANKAKLLLSEITSLCIKNNVPKVDVPSWLTVIADQNSYNPVLDYLNEQPWDGICRKKNFLKLLLAIIQKKNFLLNRWMLGAVATGISNTGLAHPGVLTFLGGQGIGKSSWIKKLVPASKRLVLPDFTFNPQDKDLVITATKFWITELSEVASTHRKADVDALKSFISRDEDYYRCPYDRADTKAPRKTAFVATVNDTQFLKDDTGNRRWWVLEATKLDYDHNINMQQVWAQYYDEIKKGASYHLNEEETKAINQENENYLPTSSIFELIQDRFMWNEPERPIKATASQVLYECNILDSKGNDSQSRQANKALQKLTGEKPKKIMGVMKYSLPRTNPRFQKLI